MRRWEYKLIDTKDVPGGGMFKVKSREDIETYLNRLGADGWEIINIDNLELEGRKSFVGVAKREKS